MISFILIFLKSGLSDPGLLKRNEHLYGIHESKIKFIHKGVYIKTRLCITCKITKPLRSAHCSECDNCILRFDDHCPWLGNCVGKGNYFYFYLSLVLINFNLLFILIFSILHLIHVFSNRTDNDKNKRFSICHALSNCISTLITMCLISLILFFSLGLFIYHTKLILNNLTTKEELKELLNTQIGNYYNKGFTKNIIDFCKRKLPEYNTLKQLNENCIINNEKISIKPYERNINSNDKKTNEKDSLSIKNKNNYNLTESSIYSNHKLKENKIEKFNKTDSDLSDNNKSDKDFISSIRDLKSIDIQDLESTISIPKENSISVNIKENNNY